MCYLEVWISPEEYEAQGSTLEGGSFLFLFFIFLFFILARVDERVCFLPFAVGRMTLIGAPRNVLLHCVGNAKRFYTCDEGSSLTLNR